MITTSEPGAIPGQEDSMLFGENIDHEALKRECETYVRASRMADDALHLGGLPRGVRERALQIADTAISRGLKPEHVKAYLAGQL